MTGAATTTKPPIAADYASANALPATTFPIAAYATAAALPATGPTAENPTAANPAWAATRVPAAPPAPIATPSTIWLINMIINNLEAIVN